MVMSESITVRDSAGRELESQLLPLSDTYDLVHILSPVAEVKVLDQRDHLYNRSKIVMGITLKWAITI
ncbi:hypothetical protein ACS0TY_033368 [Phlomoides rotata]